MFLAFFKAFTNFALSICIYNDLLVEISGDSFYCGLSILSQKCEYS